MLASRIVSAQVDADAESVVRVLVADDEPALREALAELFAQEPTLDLIGLAADADEAATLASRELPDVALIDVSMPAGGGPRATREIARILSPDASDRALGVRGPHHGDGDAPSRRRRLPGEGNER